MTVGDGGRFCALSAVATVLCAACAWAAGPEQAGTIDWANRAERPAAKLKGYLPVATPESQGGDSAKIAAWVKALDEIGDLHGFVLLRHGRLVAEGYWAPYERAFPHALNGAAGVMGAALLGAQQANGTPVEEAGELLDALTAKDPDRQLEEAFRLRELAAKRDVMYYEQAVSRRCMNYVGFTWEYAATPGDGAGRKTTMRPASWRRSGGCATDSVGGICPTGTFPELGML